MDYLALEAAKNELILNGFIEQNEKMILYTASKSTGYYITKSDDEWSIALHAFVQAVKDYDLNKGNFLSFAKLVIQRRLIDYIRKNDKYKQEIHVDPIIFDSSSDSMEEDNPVRYAVTKKTIESGKQNGLTDEISIYYSVWSKSDEKSCACGGNASGH